MSTRRENILGTCNNRPIIMTRLNADDDAVRLAKKEARPSDLKEPGSGLLLK